MRILSVIYIFSFMATVQCTGQQVETITSIEFTKQTRGYLDKIKISKDSVQGMVENHRASEKSRHYASPIDQDGWARLLLSLNDVSLKDVDGLQSPTMARAHDGAVHSTIVISFENGQTISHGFDDENPHPDLKPLLLAILEYRTASVKQ